ncbi:protein polyubiquitination [Aureococcus anophagefferens]|uniref:RING-type E3 ubiquitin transferase n=2 Tax=Aureococcus anophagefferens TaxID=44056 RepID=A0ABR1FZA6_AURAN
MASWAKYSVLSSLVTSAVVYYAFATREQFYPTVVYLVTSKVCVLCLGNQAIVFTLLVGRISKQLFLGSLREIEVELLYENSRYAITETRVAPRRPRAKRRGTPPPKPRCLALTIFREELTTRVFALFTALLFAKVFHWLVQSRVEHVEHAERVSTLSHYRLGALMLWLYVLDGAALSMCAILCIRNGPSVLLLFGFEFAILAVSLCAAASRYGLFAVEQRLYEGQWTAKGSYVFAVDFVAEVLRFAFYVVFFTIVFTYYGVPLHIVRELWVSYVSLRRRLAAYKRYRALTANMDERFPSATDEELDACGRICIICRDGMDEGKKLPCGHIFHFGCLRLWLQQQQSCPTCRMDIPVDDAPAAGAAAGDAAAARKYARDGVCVVESFFEPVVFAALAREADAKRPALRPETMESVAVGRTGCFLAPADAIVAALSGPEAVGRLRAILGDDRLVPADFPVELRAYPVGAAMGWHKDEALYDEPQLECVLTLCNSSDSETHWENADGSLESKWLPPNSLLVVRAEGASHGVSAVTVGDRVIAKYVLTASPVKLQAWYDNLDSYRDMAQP